MPIVTLTLNPAIDKNTEVERVIPERKLRCGEPHFDPGGGGINVARVLHRLGEPALALYPAGGPPAELLERTLEGEHLNHRPIVIRGWTRENLAVHETSTGQQFRFGMPGPRLETSEWQRCLDDIRDLDPVPDYLVASGSLPPGVPSNFYGRLAHLCNEKEVRLIVDTSGDPLRLSLEDGLYLIKPNLRELREIAGGDLPDEAGQEALVRSLIEKCRCRYVVVSLGAAGAIAAGPDDFGRLRAPTVKIQSKVGAGDSMVAGIVFGLSRGKSFMDAVRYGVAAGAAAVTTAGSELCRRQDVEDLYGRMSGGKGLDD
jgi:6-phosphofructokinase 2